MNGWHRFCLWTATGKAEHLEEARHLVEYEIEHAPEEHREIMEAREEHGETAEKKASD